MGVYVMWPREKGELWLRHTQAHFYSKALVSFLLGLLPLPA